MQQKVKEEVKGPFQVRIAARMSAFGMKRLEEFADYFGLGRTTVYGLYHGRVSPKGSVVKPSVDTLVKLADALEVPLHVLVYELEPEARGADLIASPPLKRIEVRMAGWVGAGPDQTEEILDEQLWIEEEFARGRELLGFKIRGDSMAAGRHPIYDGDTVVVDQNAKGHNNSPVVARLIDNGYVCKLLKEDRFSHIVKLASANPEHQNGTPTAIAPEQIEEIVGRVVRIVHDQTASSI